MQKAVRINEIQLLHLASKSRSESTLSGYLYKKSTDTGKWQLRWFTLYQNLLFYYENETCLKPSGMALLEGCYCERIVVPGSGRGKDVDKQNCFAIYYRKEGQRQYELRAETETECTTWIEAILQASFSKVLEQKEQLEQKHGHLLQILDSERQAKWHYIQQTEELALEVEKLKNEIQEFKVEKRAPSFDVVQEDSDELKKIKKVQSFFRGWLCRRRWKQIVDLYLRSEHADSMRKRNQIVFSLVECEEEYVKQLSTLVSVFLRPLRMAASSKNPPISHDDVNSIFLNSETLLFLHQIFLKGLIARMENWPTLVLDLFDMLLPMLGIYQEYVRNHHFSLQVLAEYKQRPEFNQLIQRYEEKSVCEGHSLATFLTYPMHQIPRYIITIHKLLSHTPHDHVERESLEFALSKLEQMSQVMQDEVSETENIRKNLSIERMIVEGCDILLDVNQTFVRQGTLIQVVTDKGRTSLGRLGSFSYSSKETRKETVRQVFLFSFHLLLTTRSSSGRLHLAKNCGKIPLTDCTLIEDPYVDLVNGDDDSSSYDSSLSLVSQSSGANLLPAAASETDRAPDYNGLDFRLVIEPRNAGHPLTITLVASTTHEKAAWCSDISQCIENLQYSDIINNSMSETSSVSMPQSVRSDPKLYRDDVDIKFSQSLNSCKVPQIRHASVSRLLDRLIDLRFLSIDFLNTFLLTYRVFTTSQSVLDALRRVYKNPEFGNLESAQQNCVASLPNQRVYFENEDVNPLCSPPKLFGHPEFVRHPPIDAKQLVKPVAEKLRRISTGSSRIEVNGERNYLAARLSDTAAVTGFRRYKREESSASSSSFCSSFEPQPMNFQLALPKPKLAPIASCETLPEGQDLAKGSSCESLELSPVSSADDIFTASTTITITTSTESSKMSSASSTRMSPEPEDVIEATSAIRTHFPFSASVSDRLTLNNSFNEPTTVKGLSVPSCFATGFSLKTRANSFSASHLLSNATSSDTLIPCSPHSMPSSPKRPIVSSLWSGFQSRKVSAPSIRFPASNQLDALALSPVSSPRFSRVASPFRRVTSPCTLSLNHVTSPVLRRATSPSPVRSSNYSPKLSANCWLFGNSHSVPNIITNLAKSRSGSGRNGSGEVDVMGCGFCSSGIWIGNVDHASPTAKPGTVVTSSRASRRRSSSTAAAAAFAVATAGSPHARDSCKTTIRHQLTGSVELKPHNDWRKRESMIYSAATMRVLGVLRHWVTKYPWDFETDPELKSGVVSFLEEILTNPNLLPAEYRSAGGILSTLLLSSSSKDRESIRQTNVNLDILLASPEVPVTDNFDTLSALDIAEQMTYLDHQIFMALGSEELFGQAWMKPDKATRAPHVLLVSKRFNEASRLVVSEIVRRPTIAGRVSCIEKWAAIADICRCMHNYNGLLQICAAFLNSSVFRLKKTWEKISKQSKQMIDRLQSLVSSDGRFKNMREALHRCDPPCIPYLGMYLSDLSFIEEGSSNVTDDGLINFSKMRMIAHVIREIQLFQQTPYKIENHRRVTNYLLDPSNLLEEEQTFRFSLEIEPRSNLSSVSGQVV